MTDIQGSELMQFAQLALDMYALSIGESFETRPARGLHITQCGDVRTVHEADDAYEVLAQMGQLSLPTDVASIGLHTTGWASPIYEGAPSEHPERQRVELVVVLNRNFEMVSVARFATSHEDISTTEGDGPITDALTAAMALSLRRAAS